MSYKDELLAQIEEAKQWTLENEEETIFNPNGHSERMELCSLLYPPDIEDCTFIDELEEDELDVYAVSLIIECRKNNSLFKALYLDDESVAAYKDSVKSFQNKVAFIQKASEEPINVKIPMRPRDKLYQAISVLKLLNYDENIIKSVARLVPTGKTKLPRQTIIVKELNEERMKELDKISRQKPIDIFKKLQEWQEQED